MKSTILINFTLLLFYLNFYSKKADRHIYYAGDFPWYIFYDASKNENCDIVEIGGIKYGFIDKLKKTNKNDTISISKHGVLFKKNKNLYYHNYNLEKNFKLKRVNYKSSFKEKRFKIFSTNTYLKIKSHSLSQESKKKIYETSNKDFEDFEKNESNLCEPFNFEILLEELSK
jgi:hypothetical protein